MRIRESGRGIKILVADDDRASLMLISSVLATEGYNVITASSVKEAVNHLDKGLVVLVISDIMIPGTGGVQFLEDLKSSPRLSRIPVIICSSRRDAKAVSRSLELGAKDYIAKPINRDVLLAKVERALEDNPAAVLIVDDEQMIRMHLSRLVHREGLKAVTAASGTEALELLESNKVGMVISDMAMPGMSGLELLSKIKEKYPSLPVLLITGLALQFTKEKALASGADGYITKPFKNVEIAQKLAGYM